MELQKEFMDDKIAKNRIIKLDILGVHNPMVIELFVWFKGGLLWNL